MIYHVLLVEDEPVIRESIKKSIHWDRMPIQLAAEAENGREALAYMQTMPIDIVITDMRMPVCDGSQMLKQMESLHYNCEIIVLSEYSDFSYMYQAIHAHVFDYLLKPIVPEELENSACAVAAPEKRYGFLAVCAGDGLAEVFRDLGVDRIVSGGQTMNPSTDDILREVNRTPSEVVFVLPNNKNIIMAAQQCVGLSEKEVIVVPTATVPQGISAMMAVDPEDNDPQSILSAMTAAAEHVTTAQITYAARNSDFDGFAINEGDYLALCDGKLLGTDRSLDALLEKLAQVAADKDAEFITVYTGEGVDEAQAQQASAIFQSRCPGAEITALPGGQPVYYYIVAIE